MTPCRLRYNLALTAAMAALSCGQPVLGQVGDTDAEAPATETVVIDYPDQLPLEALADYVSQTLGVHILYTDELKGQTVVLRPASIVIPKARLLDLLRTVLAARGLALVEDALPGLYRVAPIGDAARLVDTVRVDAPSGDVTTGRIVTQVIVVPSGNTKQLAARVQSFTSSGKSSLVEVPERGVIIVTDYETVVARILRLVEVLDAAPEPVRTISVALEHPNPARLCEQVQSVLVAERSARGQPSAVPVQLQPGSSPGVVLVTGAASEVDRARELLMQLDVQEATDALMRVYSPRYASVGRFRTLVERVLTRDSPSMASQLAMYADDSVNRLYVTAPEALHERIRRLLEEEDQPTPAGSRRMRIYRPQHRTAGEVLDTLTQLLEGAHVTQSDGTVDEPGDGSRIQTAEDTAKRAGPVIPMPPPARDSSSTTEAAPRSPRRVEGADYVLTEDEATNAIIAVGTPEFHTQLMSLLSELDRRPAQVLIEMTLLAVTRNNSLNLGVELEGLDLGDGTDYLLFSSFGLSTIDVATGQRVITPGVGLNGVLIRPDRVPVVLRTLATNGDSKVVSSPRMLVSDNTTATLRNVDEAPFTSVNASDTIATTSFGGFESAGTTLTVTPHIAEGDHLALDYNLTFSNFTGSSNNASVPPPRTTNSFSGQVQIPDGYTIVVGGLEVENESDAVSEIPLLGRVPIVGLLFQNSTATHTRTRIFAFIRPVVLRDDQFEDLRYLSTLALDEADVKSRDFPQDALMWMR